MEINNSRERLPDNAVTGVKPDCQNIDAFDEMRREATEEDFHTLSKWIKKLFGLTPQENIYQFIAVSLNEILKNCVVVVNSYDGNSDTLSIRAVVGLGSHADNVVNLLGKHPVSVSVPMNPDARKGLITGRLTRVSGGLYELATHAIPRIVCDKVEEVLGIKGTHAMGITWNGRILGSVALLMRAEIENPAIIETLVNYSAVVLQRQLDCK